jgi:NhaA family Na+:H+ antiporter
MLHAAGVPRGAGRRDPRGVPADAAAPAAAPLLAQAATALAALESAEREARKAEPSAHVRQKQELIRESASRNLSAASARLLSPAERIERAVAPWSAYFILPLFAFSATGISLFVDLNSAKTCAC